MAILATLGSAVKGFTSFFWDAAIKGGTEEVIGRQAMKLFTGRVKEEQGIIDLHGEFMSSMSALEAIDPATGQPKYDLSNIWKWYAEAVEGNFPYSEDTFIELLIKIPSEKREIVYPSYNRLTRDEFILRMHGLHVRRAQAAARWVGKKVSPHVQAGWQKTVEVGKQTKTDFWTWYQDQANTVTMRRDAQIQHRSLRGERTPLVKVLGWVLVLGLGLPLALMILDRIIH